MKLVVDYSGSKYAAQRLGVLCAGWPRWLTMFLQEQAEIFLEKIRLRTPVDSGRLQESWKLESIRWQGNALVAQFLNDANDGRASYASFVEYGHAKPYKSGLAEPGTSDWVMGAFMLTFTVQEMEKLIPIALHSEMQDFFAKMGWG